MSQPNPSAADSESTQDYPTDKFGRATGRNHHYRIPYSDEVAMNIATWTLHDTINAERVVTEWGDFSGNQLRYFGLETIDSKGHIDGLAKYSHSPDWSDAGILTDVQEYRHATGGGTRIVGSFKFSPTPHGYPVTLKFDTAVDLTVTEFEDALEDLGQTWTEEVAGPIRWAKDDAMAEARERLAEHEEPR
jgi:hypothetical protein